VTIEKRTNGFDADTPPGPSVTAGSTVNWEYEITNIGAEGLEKVAVTDDQGVSVSCPATTLAIGASMICTASGIAQVGQYANIGTVTATLAVSDTEVVASDASHYFGLSQPFDFGDAPDPTYPSLFASNGARHLLGGSVFLGNCVDADADAFASATADGDDLAATTPFGNCVSAGDDEDGVTFTTSLSAGQTAGVDVVASAPCTLSAWIDYSGDGDWGESDENLFPGGTALAAGINSLNFTVPVIVTPGNTFARFRCTTDGAVGFTGPANDGEVEDYAVVLIAPVVSATKTDLLAGDSDNDMVTDPGDALTYTILIRNSGNGDATSVTFTDTPDSNTMLVSGFVTTSNGTITTGNGVGDTSVSVDLGTIAAGGLASITFTVLVDDPLPPGVTTVSNQGTISGTNFASVPTDDPAVAGPADPTVTAITLTPIVTATKTAALFGDVDGDHSADPGDTLRYTITVANTGSGDASGVLFTDTPDANTALVNGSVTASSGFVTSGNTPGQTTVAVSIGTLVAGATAVIVFDVTIDNPLPPGVTQVVNSGTVTGSNIAPVMTDDPSRPGNADPTAVAVEGAAAAAVAIPTVGTWAVLALAALLGVIALQRITFG
jgi:uncharacterized repeat protein (TIGR01451 family)